MATYKVLQDIEAEDKLIGWMTPRQCIYAAIVVVSLFIGFLLTTNASIWLALPLIPHIILFAVLSGPFVHDQPSEVWLLAKIMFFLKPRRRIWDQSGVKELVTITVPKKIERNLTDGLSQVEVKSRLSALANTIDSRGWAVKNINVNLFAQPGYVGAGAESDRLLDASALPQEVPNLNLTAEDDIMDERSNPTALHLQQMIDQSAQTHRQKVLEKMQKHHQPQSGKEEPPADYWFMNATAGQQAPSQPGYSTFDRNPTVFPGSENVNTPVATAGPSDNDQEALLEKIHAEQARPNPMKNNLRTIKPLSEQKKDHQKKRKAHPKDDSPAQQNRSEGMSANEHLALRNDLTVQTAGNIAKEINKQPPDDEVVISLR